MPCAPTAAPATPSHRPAYPPTRLRGPKRRGIMSHQPTRQSAGQPTHRCGIMSHLRPAVPPVQPISRSAGQPVSRSGLISKKIFFRSLRSLHATPMIPDRGTGCECVQVGRRTGCKGGCRGAGPMGQRIFHLERAKGPEPKFFRRLPCRHPRKFLRVDNLSLPQHRNPANQLFPPRRRFRGAAARNLRDNLSFWSRHAPPRRTAPGPECCAACSPA